MWIDIDEQLLADYFTRRGSDGRRDIVFYQIVPDLPNAPGVKRLAHANADHLPRTPGYDAEGP